MTVGFGYDVHRLENGIPLIIGGVLIDHKKGLLGHSDADVLVHAIIDAILGASCKGDIGLRFPDKDSKYRNCSSLIMLSTVITELKDYRIINIDSTVVAQEPKLQRYSLKMKENIANICKIKINQINIKFKTEEKLGFTGSESGIKAYAICSLEGKNLD